MKEETGSVQIGEIVSMVGRGMLRTWRFIVRWRLIELALVLMIGTMVVVDRVRLGDTYLFRYIDEDQGVEWYAAREIMHGRIDEPCFYGQSYNSNIEGILAGPLVWMGMPYWYAVPTVTVTLSVLPFLLLGIAAWRRGQTVMAGLCLAVPALLSTRYGMITGMPRGFVTGVGFAAIPAVLMLPGRRLKEKKKEKRKWKWWWRRGAVETGVVSAQVESAVPVTEDTPLPEEPALVVRKAWWKRFLWEWVEVMRNRRSWPKTRYFLVGFLTVFAVMFNPNCVVLLGAVGVYAILTSLLEWRFWVFGLLGIGAAAPYPWWVYKFYWVWHDDYRLYLRDRTFTWSWANWRYFIRVLDPVFTDLVPEKMYEQTRGLMRWLHTEFPHEVYGWSLRSIAPMALLIVLGVVVLFLLVRLRLAALLAGLSGLAVVIASFAYDRVHDGRVSVSFPYSRMFLAVPVLLVWLMILVNASLPRKWGWTRWWRENFIVKWVGVWMLPWLWRGMLVFLVWWVWTTIGAKKEGLQMVVDDEVENGQVARVVELDEAQRIARAVQRAADQEHVSMVVVNVAQNGRKWAYVLPCLTTCETLFPSFERRTWLLYENNVPKYDKVLVLGSAGGGRPGNKMRMMSGDPAISVYTITGQSLVRFCESMGMRIRPFGKTAERFDGDWPH